MRKCQEEAAGQLMCLSTAAFHRHTKCASLWIAEARFSAQPPAADYFLQRYSIFSVQVLCFGNFI
ncbi:hypothetical protein HMPREF2139_00280 [Prevotella denticola DNF00960]|nr:hypothetical protein HMPREF2139_00280 [Prevotella denticola DNF00960]